MEYDPEPERYKWMEDVFWRYRTKLPQIEAPAGTTVRFEADGIDYAFDIFLGDTLLLSHRGMFTPISVEIGSPVNEGTELVVLIHPIPKAPGPEDRCQARESCKPPCAYGWDWHPRLVPSGIWRPCRLRIAPRTEIISDALTSSLSGDLKTGTLLFHAEVENDDDHRLGYRLLGPEGESVAEGVHLVANGPLPLSGIRDPKLWWPRGQGSQPLYTLEIVLKDANGRLLQAFQRQFGFRRIRLRMNEGAWEQPVHFPKSRSATPATVEINGRCIFAKGSNWVPPRLFPGEMDDEVFDKLLRKAAEANFNMIRVWGGGIVNPPEFYERCDALGIMVIQEFPLACNAYPDTEDYLSVLEQEARSIIQRLQRHPSLVIWSGGNELFNFWSGMDDQSRALRLLNALCYRLDPDRPFWTTVPLEGIAHGPYTYIDPERHLEVPDVIAASDAIAFTEFGQPGPAPFEIIRQLIPEAERFPPRPGTAWETRHAFHALYPETWLCENIIRHLFGESEDLEQLVERGQWLQAFGYQMIYEAARRRWPRTSMALNWCFNEIWPCAANNSLLAWPDVPKPAFFTVREACRPSFLSTPIRKFNWEPGERIRGRIQLLNDSPRTVTATGVTVSLHCGESIKRLNCTDKLEAPPLRNSPAIPFELTWPTAVKASECRVQLESTESRWNNQYRLRWGRPSRSVCFEAPSNEGRGLNRSPEQQTDE